MDNLTITLPAETVSQLSLLRDRHDQLELGLLLSEIGGRTSSGEMFLESAACFLNAKAYPLAETVLKTLATFGFGDDKRFCRLDYLTAVLPEQNDRTPSTLAKLANSEPDCDWVQQCLMDRNLDIRTSLLRSNSLPLVIEQARIENNEKNSGILTTVCCGSCQAKAKTLVESLFSNDVFICAKCAEPGMITTDGLAPFLINEIDDRASRVLVLCQQVKLGEQSEVTR